MKTPIQELMDEFAKKADSLPDTLDANAAYLVFQECYDMAKSMLEKEKEAMCEFAYKCDLRHKVYGDFMIKDYYNETFNTKEK
jgi:hypothetical protein